MRRLSAAGIAVASVAALVLSGAAPAAASPAARGAAAADDAEAAYFEVTDASRERFVIQLTDPAKIKHARAILSGDEKNSIHVMGRIEKRPREYNPKWSFHLKHETINFFEVAIEICDSTTPYLEDHLDEAGGAFLPGGYWCPWSSKLTREIKG
jgi:hypothetical protein